MRIPCVVNWESAIAFACTREEDYRGKKNSRLYQAAGAGRQGQPSPPLAPRWGSGLNIMEFCKAFNAATQKMEVGLPVPVVITAYADKSFTFTMKTTPATVLIKKAAGVGKGSPKPHTDKVGRLTRKQAGRNRPVKNAGFNRGRHGRGRSDCCGQRPEHGRRSGGGVNGAYFKRLKAIASKGGSQQILSTLPDALNIIKETATAKFDESVDVAVNLGIDAKKSDQAVRGLSFCPLVRANLRGSQCLPKGTRPRRRLQPARILWDSTISPNRSRQAI